MEISEAGVSPHPEVGAYDQILIFVAKHKMPELFGATLGEFIATLFVPGGLLLLAFDAVGRRMVLQKCDGDAT